MKHALQLDVANKRRNMMIIEEKITTKGHISREEYRQLVHDVAAIKVYKKKDENGNYVGIEYHPEYFTSLLPTFIAGYCLNGVVFEDGESIFDDGLAEKLEQDSRTRGVINAIKRWDYTCTDVDDYEYPSYFWDAVEDANEIVEFELKKASPVNELCKYILDFSKNLFDLTKDMEPEQLKAIADQFNNLITEENKQDEKE
jgi:hypothetical protein